MNKGLVGGIAFVAGAALGCLATRQYFKTKYEKMLKDDLDERREVNMQSFKNDNSIDDSQKEIQKAKEKIENAKQIKEYNQIIEDTNYTGYSKPKEEVQAVSMDDPYIIDSDEFGEIEDYEAITVYYYADDNVADTNDELITDVEECIGYDAIQRLDDGEDVVYVRNDKRKKDYEVIKEEQIKFEDLMMAQEYEE